MSILLTGASGQLGRCLQARLGPARTLLAFSSNQLDVSDKNAVMQAVESVRPDVIVNAAAYNAVDGAEHDAQRAFAVNAHGPAFLARAARRCGARLVHISTDYVFAGDVRRPYAETDTPGPLNVYGASKRQGELAVLDEDPTAIIVRTSWLYSEYGTNFVKTMLRLAHEKRPIQVVDDQFGTPTYAGDLADVLIAIAGAGTGTGTGTGADIEIGASVTPGEDAGSWAEIDADADADAAQGARAGHRTMPGGVYHYSGDSIMSWYELARAVLQCADELAPAGRAKLLVPISTAQYSARAKRPPYSALACDKIAALGFRSQSTKPNLRKVVERMWPKMAGLSR